MLGRGLNNSPHTIAVKTALYADASYFGEENATMLRGKEMHGKISHKRKPGRDLTERQKEQNTRCRWLRHARS